MLGDQGGIPSQGYQKKCGEQSTFSNFRPFLRSSQNGWLSNTQTHRASGHGICFIPKLFPGPFFRSLASNWPTRGGFFPHRKSNKKQQNRRSPKWPPGRLADATIATRGLHPGSHGPVKLDGRLTNDMWLIMVHNVVYDGFGWMVYNGLCVINIWFVCCLYIYILVFKMRLEKQKNKHSWEYSGTIRIYSQQRRSKTRMHFGIVRTYFTVKLHGDQDHRYFDGI